MQQGYSFEAFGGRVGVSKQTLYNWEKKFPEFAEAKAVAFEACRFWWEGQGIQNVLNTSESMANVGSNSKSLNSAVWIFNMKNRFPDEWRDKREIVATPNEPIRLSYPLDERKDEDEDVA